MADNERQEPGYIAFISYSREDEAFAKQLETEIEAYQRPGSTVSARVFRDRSDFTGSAYESALDGHLRNAKTLIVLCSPHARNSTFVGDEIRRFASHHGTERIFPILVSGLPDNEADDKKAFPPALLEVMKGSGIPLGAEYRGLDLRKERVNAGRFEGEWYKLLGNIYGVTPAEIRDEDSKRQVRAQQRKVVLYGVAVLVLLGLLSGALLLWQRASAAKAEALAAKAEAVKLKDRAETAERQATEMSRRAETELGLSQKAQTELKGREREPAEPPPAGSAATGDRLPTRVYIHVRNEQQLATARNLASGLKAELEQAGLRVVVPPIERLDVGPTKSSELRFFRDADGADAERIAHALRAQGVNDLVVKKVPGFEDSSKIRPRHFELWLKPPGTTP